MFKKYSKVLIASTLSLALAACGGGGGGGGSTTTNTTPTTNSTGQTITFPFTNTYLDFHWLQNPGNTPASNTSTATFQSATSVNVNYFSGRSGTVTNYDIATGGAAATYGGNISKAWVLDADSVAVQVCEPMTNTTVVPNVTFNASMNALLDKNRVTAITTALGLANKNFNKDYKNCGLLGGTSAMTFAADGAMTYSITSPNAITFTATATQVNNILSNVPTQVTVTNNGAPVTGYISMNAYSYTMGTGASATTKYVVVLRSNGNLTGNTGMTSDTLEMWTF